MALNRFGTKIYKNYMDDNNSARQIIVAENGVFVKAKANSLCFVTKKTTFEKYGLDANSIEFLKTGDTPLYLEEKPYMRKKIPYGLIKTILRFYQVYAKKGLEVKVNVWYDHVNEEFFLDCPFQVIGGVHAQEFDFEHHLINWTDELKAKFPRKYELREKRLNREIEKILETHSHHNMGCSFSSIDDVADYFDANGSSLIGVYITVIKNPRLHLRYFLSPEKNRIGSKTSLTRRIDEVLFKEEDIIDFSDDEMRDYDFNEFASHVNITDREILESKVLSERGE